MTSLVDDATFEDEDEGLAEEKTKPDDRRDEEKGRPHMGANAERAIEREASDEAENLIMMEVQEIESK